MNPSQDQVKSAVRTLLAAGGSALAGWFLAKGYLTQANLTEIAANPLAPQLLDSSTTIILTALASLPALAAGVWGMIAHKQANLVATVAAMPEISEVKTMPTAAGSSLASAANAVTGPAKPLAALVTVAGPVKP